MPNRWQDKCNKTAASFSPWRRFMLPYLCISFVFVIVIILNNQIKKITLNFSMELFEFLSTLFLCVFICVKNTERNFWSALQFIFDNKLLRSWKNTDADMFIIPETKLCFESEKVKATILVVKIIFSTKTSCPKNETCFLT